MTESNEDDDGDNIIVDGVLRTLCSSESMILRK